jgi:thioredoxin family protein
MASATELVRARRARREEADPLREQAQGGGSVAEQRLYQLIRQPRPIAEQQFEIEFLEPGVEVFAFTFG